MSFIPHGISGLPRLVPPSHLATDPPTADRQAELREGELREGKIKEAQNACCFPQNPRQHKVFPQLALPGMGYRITCCI